MLEKQQYSNAPSTRSKQKSFRQLDDDFAKDVSEFDTLDEYKEEIKDNLTKKKEEQAKTEKENAVVDKAVENATMEIPEAMIDTQVETHG